MDFRSFDNFFKQLCVKNFMQEWVLKLVVSHVFLTGAWFADPLIQVFFIIKVTLLVWRKSLEGNQVAHHQIDCTFNELTFLCKSHVVVVYSNCEEELPSLVVF